MTLRASPANKPLHQTNGPLRGPSLVSSVRADVDRLRLRSMEQKG